MYWFYFYTYFFTLCNFEGNRCDKGMYTVKINATHNNKKLPNIDNLTIQSDARPKAEELAELEGEDRK